MDTSSLGSYRRGGGGRGEHRHRATLEATAIGTIHPEIPASPGSCSASATVSPSPQLGSPQTSSQAEGTLLARWEGQGVPRWEQELLVSQNGDLLELHQAQLLGVPPIITGIRAQPCPN